MIDVLSAVIVGALTGFGNALGTYFAAKWAVNHFEKIGNKIKEKKK